MRFLHLNPDWKAEPNAPSVDVQFDGGDARLTFLLDPFGSRTASITFANCSRWNWDATNDHAWFAGEGRYAKQAPKWGEFYEVIGEAHLGGHADWEIRADDFPNARHFLFYFRDETLEFIATDWAIARG
ncbi:hypothetical protein [Rhizobium sp.]